MGFIDLMTIDIGVYQNGISACFVFNWKQCYFEDKKLSENINFKMCKFIII